MPVTTFALIGAGIIGKVHAANVNAHPGAVRAGAPASPDLAEGLRAQAVAEAARESLVQARPVRIDNVWR